jgi:hypothetical protein
VIDRMVKEGGARPAVVVDKLPSGPRRSLRAAIRGGWIGTPGPRDRRAGAAEARVAIEAARSAPEIEACGLRIGPAIHEMAIALARRRAAADLARARMLRRLFARRRPAAILSAWDSEPTARLVIHLAKEAGIRTFVLSHGAYLLSTVARDMDFGDEILTWSDAMEFPKPPAGTPTHVVGYPAAPGPIPPTRRFGGDPAAARIMVLSQPATVSLIDSRAEMDGYLTAIDAIAGQAPGATIVLRPHPASGRASAEAAARRYPHSQVAIDTETHIGELLAGCDLCVGAATAATLQAALVGTPVIALNLTGFDWEWPLGHGGSVPVVASRSELEDWLARWLAGEELPGRSEMLAALGVNGSDSTGRIIDLVTGRAS